MFMIQNEPKTGKKAKRRHNERPSSSGVLYFVLAFIGALLIFAGIGAIWVKVADPYIPLLNENKRPSTITTTTTLPSSRFSVHDRFSIAVYITDDKGVLQSTSVAVFKPDLEAVTTLGFPAELKLPDSDTDTLARRFETGGAEAAQMALSAQIGKLVDYYVVMSYTNVESYFQSANESLIVKLTKNIDQQAEDGSFSIHLTEGEQALNPKQIANLLRCDNWQGGNRERVNMHATLVSAYINRFVVKSRSLEDEHAKLMAASNSNFNSDRFAISEIALTHLASLGKDPLCTTMYIDGTFSGAGTSLHFTPTPSVVDSFTADMK